jgi:hypothetical protein
MTGNVGHARRMDYTAVGDVTNTASRIEGMTKATPFSILIAESTIEALSNRPDDLLYYDELEVRGRHAKLKLWALDIRKPEDGPEVAKVAEVADDGKAPDGAASGDGDGAAPDQAEGAEPPATPVKGA